MSDPTGIVWDAAPAPTAGGIQWDDVPQQPGFLQQAGRVLGQTARYGLEGAGNALGIVTDPFMQFVPGSMPMGQSAAAAADALGLPKPEGKLEDKIAAASRAVAGTGLTAGLGQAAGAAELAAQPITQALSSALGGYAQEAAKQGGAGEGGQAAAAALASLAPGAGAGLTGLAKTALRGGAVGQQRILDNLAEFAGAGTTPTVAQATEGGFPRLLESILAKVPGGSGVMAAKAEQQAGQLGAKANAVADALAPGSDPTQAGIAIQQGIAGEGGFVDRFKQQAKALYDAVDQHMPGDAAVPLPATQALLNRLTTPIRGAEATSGVLANPKLNSIASAITADTRNSQFAGLGNQPLPAGSVTFDANGMPQLGQGETMPYTAIKQLRTKVGDMIADAGLVSDVPRGQLKQLYGALSEDMRNGLNDISPDAYTANNQAENFYRNGIDHIDKLDSIVGNAGGAEAIYKAAIAGTKDGATTINQVMSALQPDQQKVVASAVIKRLGLATAGAQNDLSTVFSPQTFLTNWNKISPQAKQVLFQADPDTRSALDQIAAATSNMREGAKTLPNSSGTTPSMLHAGTALSAIGALWTGNLPALAAIAGTTGASNLGARLMTNPNFVKWLANNTAAPVGVLPGQIGYLGALGQKTNDPDLVMAAQLIGGPSSGQTGQ